MTSNSLMLFTAGLGTRMRPLTNERPKPLVCVNEKPLIDHALEPARDAGFSRIVGNVHHMPDMMKQALKRRNVQISDESARLLDTGGGLRKAAPLLGEGPIATMNTDAVWRGENPFLRVLKEWRQHEMDALLLLIDPDRAHGHNGTGDFHLDDGKLTRGPGHIFSGCQIINPKILEEIEADVFSLNVAWNLAIDRGRLFGVVFDGHWCDVGRPDAIPIAEAMLKNARDV